MDLQFDDLSETARRIHDLRSDIGYLTLSHPTASALSPAPTSHEAHPHPTAPDR